MNEGDSRRTTGERRDGDPPLSLDTVFRVLAHPRRRRILDYLTVRNCPVPLEELVEKVAVQESEAHVGDIPAEVYDQVALDLHHAQLPKLAELGVVDYSRDRNSVAIADAVRPLDEYLRLAKQHDSREADGRDHS